ncbi:Fic/DOC family protein [Austwickia chelonae]|uniref:Fido domain-containing protein n=1 Tax=Austwickia chelonae NBRC 105200 TaxID=1184607 RepID=K6VNV3_9MICO|nr:Fic family protein [Austwickia chelonae]GAB77030.1 hypothetical protein AUCHE_04_00710 [Austwickia chelonae NBRC 105200]SEW33405.1 Fic/DOC family protein [Austwickia chelonae]
MTLVADLQLIARWPAVASSMDEVREACTALRWHPALRRRIPESASESRVRGAWASAELEGVRIDAATVRLRWCGLAGESTREDASAAVVQGAVQVTAESEYVTRLLRRSPAQALGRLHVAAAAGLLSPEQVGRPRRPGEEVHELVDLGPVPAAEELSVRLHQVGELLTAAGAPAFVAGALIHAEILHLRPFVRGNGLVARALERAYLQESGLDPTGVAVCELGQGHGGHAAYLGAAAAYATGTREGLEVWLAHWSNSMSVAVAEGVRIADEVRVGKLNKSVSS